MMAISSLYFIITGIQFWVSDYLMNVLNVSQETVFIAFAVSCVSGPTIGVIVGGVIVHKIGGYRSPRALPLC
jgi:sugar phosphate permease